MKKSIFMVALLLGAATTSFAQKANLDNPFSLEGAMNFAGGGVTWEAPNVRARYFVNDNIAVRASIGLGDGLGTPRSESYNFSDSSGNMAGTRDIARMAWNASIGAEYHLEGTERMSPYFGLGINFGGGSYNETWGDSDGTAYVQGLDADVNYSQSMFGLQLGAGLDIYLIDNLYCGFELGLGFSSYTYGDITTDVTMGGNTTTTVDYGGSETYIGTGAGNASVRFGWRF
jgi:outer membrane protein W